ncbi:MAG: hypothetical protein CMH56_07980 [Myxococcales bacterium]|nr:hypothetical protein [Myxococcales bacterium]|tara:strand:+ start:494 stop:1633 length:1140 start_codon:yes stop_codon:yes gene_type:complete
MRFIFLHVVLLAALLSGCPEGPASIDTPSNNPFMTPNSTTDGGTPENNAKLDAGSGPATSDMDAGAIALQTTDGGPTGTPTLYVPCEGEWVFVVNNELVPVDSSPVTDAGVLGNFETYWSCDLLFLKSLADNSGLTTPILEVGSQSWADGRLTNLYAGNSGLSGPLSPRVGDAGELLNLSLSQNQLEGPIPDSITRLTNLTFLNLGSNRLSGSIPEQMGELHQLNTLDLRVNQLEGSIPESLSSITNLRYLLLSHNDLTGPFPPTLALLGDLRSIELFQNELSGPLPPDIGNLNKLQYLSISNNQFSGPLPPTLNQLVELTRLLVADNEFEGFVDETICTLNIDWESDNFSISNNNLCPAYPSCINTLMGNQDTASCGN